MEASVTLLIILGAISGLSHGAGVLPDSLIATVGETMTFTTTVTPPGTPFLAVTWSFVDIHGAEINIVTSSQVNITGVAYTDRVTLFRSTGSLELKNLTLNDTGEYTVTVIPSGGAQLRGNCRLVIHAPVSNVNVTSNTTDLMEFSSSVSLSCSSSGSSLTFLWLNSSSEVVASERVQLIGGGRTLTIVNVTRYDRGSYRCHVFNPVSNGTSDPVNLSIIFGPDNINLTKSPSQEYYDEGSDIILMCSAASSPSALFQWFLDGHMLSDTGPVFRLMNIHMSQSGNYSCQAFNNKTLNHQTSQPSAITVLKSPISNVVITPNTTDLVEFSSSVSLSCSSSGSFPSFLWLNGSSEVTASEKVQLTDEGATLTIINVTRYDQGPFRCYVFNNVSNCTSNPVKLSVSYGPENINLKLSPLQEFYEKGSNIMLSCSAASRPSAQFHWFLNGGLLSHTGPELTLMNIQESQSGNYSCQAFNNRTVKYQTTQPSVVSILSPISNVVVISNTTSLLEFNSSVSLSCSSSGSSLSVLWLNGSSEVTTSERVQLTDGGRTLTIVSVTRYDQGPFKCNVSNGVSDGFSQPVNLVIQYGPDSVNIVGPESVHVGDFTMLHCSSMSVPSSTFTWLLNGNPANVHGAMYIIPSSRTSDSGEYTCTAVNTATGQSQTVHHKLSVLDFSDCGCSAAVGRAITVTASCCLVIAVVSGIIVYCLIRRRKVISTYPAHQKEKLSGKEKHSDMYKMTEKVQNNS